MSKKISSPFVPILLVLLLAAVAWSSWESWKENQEGDGGGPVLGQPTLGQWMDIPVEGWLNTPQPITENDLAGKWVVVDCWATWCGPCIASLPHLADLNQRYRGRGVVVLGVTSEGSGSLAEIHAMMARVEGFTWPVAYGGKKIFRQLQVKGIPTLVIYNPQGNEVWRGHSPAKLEKQLALELREP